jgi:hypothetical protein
MPDDLPDTFKILGWQPRSRSDNERTLRHYRQFPDLDLATHLHRKRVEHRELLDKYPDLKDPVIRISHPQLPHLQRIARLIRLMEQIQAERIAPPVGTGPTSPVESISAPGAQNSSPASRALNVRPSKRTYFDPTHEQHVKLWEQVKRGRDFKFEAWLAERKDKFSKTTFTDYIAGRIKGRVGRGKRLLIEQEIRGSIGLLGPTRTNSD